MNGASAFKELRRLAEKQGWTITRTMGGHLMWCSPQGRKVLTAGTPGGGRSVANTRALLRRAGLRLSR